jgi:DNA-directed RNA polymerase subunit H (RpoH/RPB5)
MLKFFSSDINQHRFVPKMKSENEKKKKTFLARYKIRNAFVQVLSLR